MIQHYVTALCVIFLGSGYAPAVSGVRSTYFGHETLDNNLFGNPWFDAALVGESSDSWYARRQDQMDSGLTSDGCYYGEDCAYAKSRSDVSAGLYSRVPVSRLKPATNYWVSLWVNFAQDGGSDFEAKLVQTISYNDGSPDQTEVLMSLPHSIADNRWNYMASDLTTPDADMLYTVAYIEYHVDVPVEVDYLLDGTAMDEIVETDWRAEAQANIETYRKGDLQLRINVPECIDPTKVKIKMEQTQGVYPWGSMTYADVLTDYQLSDRRPEDRDQINKNDFYRDYFIRHYNWATFNHRPKWTDMEKDGRVEDDSKFTVTDDAIAYLKGKKKNIRGHCLVWNGEEFQPEYVRNIQDKEEFLNELNRRIDYMTEHFRDSFVHYDVSNEHAGSFYLEQKTGKRDILLYLHNRTRANDKSARLFTNDINTIENSLLTAKVVNNARKLKEKNLIDGVGLQGHFSFADNHGDPLRDIQVIKRRLDVFRGLGLPIWITELDTDLDNFEAEAKFYDDILLLFYGTPEVEGIMFWGLEQFVLYGYENNLPGEVVQRRILEDWRTYEEFKLTGSQFSESYRVFKGSYKITARYQGKTVGKGTFEVGTDDSFDLDLNCI